MQRVLVVLPFYGGSLPIGRYCASALRDIGCLVEVFDAPAFYGAFDAVKGLNVSMERQEYLENSFLQVVTQSVLATVERFEPDLVLCMAQAPLSRQGLSRLRKDGVTTAMWFVEDYRLFTYWRAFAPLYDVFAVIQREPFLSELARSGVANALYLPLAADPAVHKPLDLSPAERQQFGAELSFMGAGYPNRRTAFHELVKYGLKIWGTEWDGDPILAPAVQMRGRRISTEDAVRIFNAACINLNLHSSVKAEEVVSGGDFVNPRTFEIAACGAFQLVDTRTLMADLFEEGDLATFSSLGELEEKIIHFAAHPEERNAYALRGRERVLASHTYTARMRTLLDFVEERLPGVEKRVDRDWPEDLPEALRKDLGELYTALGLPSGSGFTDVVAAVRGKNEKLTPLETAILFLDEWKKQYSL
ncbi:MAG: glycosyltransferase [Deltaproteobacteria bacterium]|nr:glycosyltransferase [Deltaproteobacteria bacterium]